MKSNTRKRIALIRNSLRQEEVLELSHKIKENLFSLKEYQEAKTILFYFSFGSEVVTTEIIQESLKDKTVLLPQVINSKKTINACKITDYKKDLTEGFSNIVEPKEYCERFSKDKIDLIIVPGVAFGEKGERLGYGSGFYDRFLKGCSGTFVGICFEVQLTDKIVEEEHDVRMHKIVTEKRVINCKI